MKSLAVLALAFVSASAAHGQLFTVLPVEPAAPGAWATAGPRPKCGAIVGVEVDALSATLAKAPLQRLDAPLATYGMTISLPGPTGELIECVIAESPVMEPGLQERFPQMRTYLAESLDGTASGRIELTQRGLTGMLRTTHDDGAVWMIDPWQSGDPLHAVAYWLRDLPGGGDWVCETAEGVHGFGTPEAEVAQRGGGTRAFQILRTLRIAIACTGEYGVYHSQLQGRPPNIPDPLAAIVTVVARSNVVYEADLGVHFNLVANNDRVVFINPATDPYPNSCDGSNGADCSGGHLSPNISTLNNLIGLSNFDVGHVLTRIVGGVAFLSSVCGSNRAGGVSGIPRGGDIDPFSALIVIHELGHQFGANHTFSGTRGRCGGNANLSTAWEAGSGSSPMAYAGACPVGGAPPSDNIVQFADPFFHHGSLGEMRSFLGTITCPAQTTTTNNIPVIASTTPNTNIPPGTPFVLTANATDADADVLTYSWEQFDSGAARPLSGAGSADNGMGALFRVFPPVLSPERTFPRMADILSGIPTPGERLPTVTGVSRRFRVCVRDNHPGAGGVAISPFVTLTLPPGTAPFGVTGPAQGAILNGGLNAVSWTVGGTNLPPISCASVTIRLSTDNGVTFTETLGTFPNSGNATVTLPAATGTARLRIDANDNIFFAISRPFVLRAPCAADYNYDDAANSQDFFDFISDFFTQIPSTDFNHDGFINSQDLFDYIAVFFAGC